MEVEADYVGARLSFPLTEELVLSMLEHFKQGRPLHAKYAFQLLKHARDIFLKENTLQQCSIAQGSKVSAVCSLYSAVQCSAVQCLRCLTCTPRGSSAVVLWLQQEQLLQLLCSSNTCASAGGSSSDGTGCRHIVV
jgi:PPP5 TPR repeat region